MWGRERASIFEGDLIGQRFQIAVFFFSLKVISEIFRAQKLGSLGWFSENTAQNDGHKKAIQGSHGLQIKQFMVGLAAGGMDMASNS